MNRNELIETLALANEFKEGDLLVGGTRDDQLRLEARTRLAAVRLSEIADAALVEDQITETLHRSLDRRPKDQLVNITVGDLKEILCSKHGAAWIKTHSDGLTSEAIAAVARLMTDNELGAVSREVFNPLSGAGVAIGSREHFGSRIQPNSPGDDEDEILFSILEGLTYGCGDVIIGLNPASDDVGTIIRLEQLLCSVVERLELPTRYSVLSDIVKQSAAKQKTRVDVGFQSLAGTSKGLIGMMGMDVDGLSELTRGFDGLYFETGQGSAVTNYAAEGIDMVTLESRAYGLARYLRKQTGVWTIVNDVSGFIGPEVFRTGPQLLRACLEDTFMAKLHGLTMGLDICATFHMGIEPSELQQLTDTIAQLASPSYLMAVAGNADPMLGYLTTSFRDHLRIRRRTGKQISSPMQTRMTQLGVMNESGVAFAQGTESLYAIYKKAAGEKQPIESLRTEASKKLVALRERGFDLGGDKTFGGSSRVAAIYAHARNALYAKLDDGVIDAVSPRNLRVKTNASSRDDFLAHPSTGERISDRDAALVKSLYPNGRPKVQFVISDGLNANALNHNLRRIVPQLRRELGLQGHDVGGVDIIVENGRVRAGYHIGLLLDVWLVVHFIGERPGTGIDTAAAYLTYGRGVDGLSRWAAGIDHSSTNAVCGIHPRGKRPESAVSEIAHLANRMFEQQCSGVILK
jgi:ethanolamine ammonia-lyase large subunit